MRYHTAGEIKTLGREALFAKCDVTDETDVIEMA